MTVAVLLTIALLAYLLLAAVHAWLPDTHPWKSLGLVRDRRRAWHTHATYGRPVHRRPAGAVYPTATDAPGANESRPRTR